MAILLVVIVLFRNANSGKMNNSGKEGFEQNEKFIFKKGDDVYDEFYSTIYDHLVHNDTKDTYEMTQIFKITSPNSKSVVLDVGSGTGHHVGKLAQKNIHATGVDSSAAMVKKAQENYPEEMFMQGNVLDTHLFSFNTFTHILCLYFTIYFIKDKRHFFDNCMDWLIPGGYLVVHLVDPEHFDPILPPGNPLYIVSPQKYAKKRITKTKINFNKFAYHSNFNYNPEDEIATFEEKFQFDNGNTRKQEQVMYMESADKIVTIGQQCGFILQSKVDLVKCAYEYQYLYIFQKPG
jgi:SAM-dependent methyltransferase